ncbi:uncharacterized protein [Typha latifolia]|uniref:uncharacterized protein n=1 Tax=Typha latifolia TaxID=4733 RepID=UPI003C2CFB4C
MGNTKLVEKKRKKKGRPSLLDLQKRSLRLQKQEQLQRSPNPNPNHSSNSNPYLRFPAPSSGRRITRRNPNPEPSEAAEPAASDDDDEEEEGSNGKRREKKLKLVLRLPTRSSANSAASGSDSDSGDGGGRSLRKRKIASDGDRDKTERHNSSKAMDSQQEDPSDSGPTTPLPDKKLLEFILDRLQKKDTYKVFAEPVDPDELPDYHEIIKHPMDFGTVRKKLSSGAYASLEQFEKDVFLISWNAMRYNAPDTIYFRQARAIQELAKKNFENLRQESDDNEPEHKTVVRRGRPPNKNKKSHGKPSELAALEFSSDATRANSVNNSQWCSLNYDVLRKGFMADKAGSTDISRMASGLPNAEGSSWLSEQKMDRNEEYLGSAMRGMSMKNSKKSTVIDENRRNTYRQPQLSAYAYELPVLAAFDGEKKQLVPVGLQLEYAYARSLARFAANFGPIGWSIASKRIERVLPPGTKFGPGWVGDGESQQQSQPLLSTSPHPSPQLKISPCTTLTRSEKLLQLRDASSNESVIREGHLSRTLPAASTSATPDGSSDSVEGAEAVRFSNYENGVSISSGGDGGGDDSGPKAPFQLHRNSGMHPTVNGIKTSFNFSVPQQLGQVGRPARPPAPFGSESRMTHAQALGMVSRSNSSSNSLIHQKHMQQLDAERAEILGNPMKINSVRRLPDGAHGPWRGSVLQPRSESVPPDLNVGFQSPGSPASGLVVDSQQPDLALQL